MARKPVKLTQKRFALAFRKLFPTQAPDAVVACSGGVDSMVLLDLLRAHYERAGRLDDVSVCHLNHNQRPRAETLRDENVIGAYCARHGLTLEKLSLALESRASEAEMRAARYAALAQVAGSRAVVFTAHHADDQLETFLLKLVRGAHPKTLKGVAPRARRRAGDRTLRLARPLLAFGKTQLTAYASEQKLEWNEDSTNRSSAHARNRIRNELVPLLNQIRPGSDRRVLRFAEAIFADSEKKTETVSEERAQGIAEHLRSTHGYLTRDADFASLRSALHLLLDQESQRTTGAHWESLKRQLDRRALSRQGGGPAKTLQFPGGHALRFHGNRLFWVKFS